MCLTCRLDVAEGALLLAAGGFNPALVVCLTTLTTPPPHNKCAYNVPQASASTAQACPSK